MEILPGDRQAAEAAGGTEVRELRRPLGHSASVCEQTQPRDQGCSQASGRAHLRRGVGPAVKEEHRRAGGITRLEGATGRARDGRHVWPELCVARLLRAGVVDLAEVHILECVAEHRWRWRGGRWGTVCHRVGRGEALIHNARL